MGYLYGSGWNEPKNRNHLVCSVSSVIITVGGWKCVICIDFFSRECHYAANHHIVFPTFASSSKKREKKKQSASLVSYPHIFLTLTNHSARCATWSHQRREFPLQIQFNLAASCNVGIERTARENRNGIAGLLKDVRSRHALIQSDCIPEGVEKETGVTKLRWGLLVIEEMGQS